MARLTRWGDSIGGLRLQKSFIIPAVLKAGDDSPPAFLKVVKYFFN